MPLTRKRRSDHRHVLSADEESASSSDANELPQQHARRRRRRAEGDCGNDDDDDDDEGMEAPHSDDSAVDDRTPSSTDVMVKKLVRMALAYEYSRQVIRRTEISAKVLGETGTRQFKPVFEAAQASLRSAFGMEMVELPVKEKVTISQKRAAQRVEKQSSSNKSWIVVSTLSRKYRGPDILTPAKAPSTSIESSYTAFYTFVISLILLHGGALPEQKLDRYLKRTNADMYTPVDRTDRLLQRLCKEGYLVRTREMDGGDEIIEYLVGPRGKIEVGEEGVAGLVREVYGCLPGAAANSHGGDDMSVADREKIEEFEKRLQRSLGISKPLAAHAHEDAARADDND